MTDFRPQQAKYLSKLLARPPVGLRKKTAEGFVLRYVFLEAVLRLVGRYYHDRAGQKKKPTIEDSSLQVDVVERSLRYFAIKVSRERLDFLLASAKSARRYKSARILRNGLVHRWDAGDAAEAIDRWGDLIEAIDAVVGAVQNRVKVPHDDKKLSSPESHTTRVANPTVVRRAHHSDG